MKYIDMHCDTIDSLLLYRPNESLRENSLHIDLKKMKKSNYMLQNFAIFTNLGKFGDNPMSFAMKGIAKYYQEIEANKDLIKPIYSFKDIEENNKNGLMSSMLTLEEGAVINNDLTLLEVYYKLGVRMITLTWNYENGIGFPNFKLDESNPNCLYEINCEGGLTDFGFKYIKKMEELGMIIDVSHLGDKGFWDVINNATKPIVASHSNSRKICGVARNLTDEMILKLHENGGVMGINYCDAFIDSEYPDVEHIVNHIDHIKELGCIDNVGLGSDFDGINDRKDLKDASCLNELYDELVRRNYTEEEIEKICYKNVLRVYREVLQ